jgi:serine/threonine protein kinase
MVRKTRRASRGGKFVFSGAYGCAYRPAMKCKGEAEREPGTISKLMKTNAAVSEMTMTPTLKALDPEFKYFVYPYKMCIPDDIQPDNNVNNVNSCKINIGMRVRNRGTQKLPSSQLLIFKDGGTDLSKLYVPPEDYAGYFHGFSYLFVGLTVLNNNGVIHFDIKPNNLVGLKQDNGTYLMRYIDFGLSRKMSTLSDGTNDEMLFSDYPYWSFELKFLQKAILSGEYTISEADIRSFYNSLEYNKEMFPYWAWYNSNGSQKVNPTWCRVIIDDIKRGRPISDILMNLDTFALGRTLSELYCRLTGHYSIGPNSVNIRSNDVGKSEALKAYHIRLRDTVSIPFYKLIIKMTSQFFWNRPTAQEAYDDFKKILAVSREVFESYPAALKV